MARRQVEEQAFGSDSFLDIVANIVGILIILIVVAGVRVSRTPLRAKTMDSHDADLADQKMVTLWSNEPVENDAPIAPSLFLDEEQVPIRKPNPVAPFTPPSVEPLPEIAAARPPENLMTDADALQQELDQLKSQTNTVISKKDNVDQQVASAMQLLSKSRDRIDALSAEIQARKQKLALIEDENRQSQQVVDQLEERLQDVHLEQPEKQTLTHRLNPVARVTGREVHFRLEHNKVSYVPVEQLTQLVKQQMERRKDFLLKQPRYQATVGPIDGYTMEFLVQRQSNNVFGGSQFGRGMIRISVTDWLIKPTEHVREETLDELLQANSNFRRALLSQGSTATVTFWVYPDSYELHRELKEYLHDAGMWVASRPLPADFPIAGSSNGSKSVAQ